MVLQLDLLSHRTVGKFKLVCDFNFNALNNFWQQNGAGIDLADYMNYDPYLGRITENSQAQQQSTMDQE